MQCVHGTRNKLNPLQSTNLALNVLGIPLIIIMNLTNQILVDLNLASYVTRKLNVNEWKHISIFLQIFVSHIAEETNILSKMYCPNIPNSIS